MQPRSCLHRLLPPPRDPPLLSRLTAPSKFPHTNSGNKKYKSFISYVLNKYQTSLIDQLTMCVICYFLHVFIVHCVFMVFYVLCHSVSVAINKYTVHTYIDSAIIMANTTDTAMNQLIIIIIIIIMIIIIIIILIITLTISNTP